MSTLDFNEVGKVSYPVMQEMNIHVKSKEMRWEERRRSPGGNKLSRVYIDVEDETILEHLENRRSRPYTLYKKHIMPKVLELLGLPEDTEVYWSQYAGCSCPCSPGFVIKGGQSYNLDIWVTVTGDQADALKSTGA